MRKNSRWLIAQSNNHYSNQYDYGNNYSYLFLLSKTKRSGDVVWDMNGGEWILDGVGHMTFRLELIS